MQFSTLHQAIAYLLSINKEMSSKEILEAIVRGDLWRRPKDGLFPSKNQIHARLSRHPELFLRDANGFISLIKEPVNQWKMTRITYNEKGWVEPSGLKGKSKTKGLHEGDHGFGHEEWLFDFSKTKNGYKYGFIEGFRTPNNKHGGETFDLQLFTIDSVQKQKYWVAQIHNCYVLTEEEQKAAQKLYKVKGWLKEKKEQLKNLGLLDKSSESSLNIFFPNIRFLESDVTFFDPPLEITSSPYINNRDRYLLYDWDDVAEINFGDQFNFQFRSSKPNRNKKVFRSNNPEFHSKEIRQLHRQIAEQLYNELCIDYGENNIGCDLPNNSGTYIDMVRREKGKYVFYEIKTYNQLRKNIRESLGQLLEYAYWDRSKSIQEMVIVSDKLPDKASADYLKFLKQEFKIPISYKRVQII